MKQFLTAVVNLVAIFTSPIWVLPCFLTVIVWHLLGIKQDNEVADIISGKKALL